MNRQEEAFSIQQVSLKLNIPKATLRFWQKELSDFIVPLRTRGGQRRYTHNHISIIEEVRKLRENRMRLSEIKRYFRDRSKSKDAHSEFRSIDFLADHIAEIVRVEIYNFFNFTPNRVEE